MQQKALYNELQKVYRDAKSQGVERVLFSVCAISAGFDLDFSKSLIRLMQEEGPENFVFSLFLPFNREAVTRYSVENGLSKDYWLQSWQEIQDLATKDLLYKDSIFIHEPRFIPIDGEECSAISPDEKQADARGLLVNGATTGVYSDVNIQMVLQALTLAKGDVSQLQGIFGDAGRPDLTKNLLGGAPEVIGMYLYLGVPEGNIIQVPDGLTDWKPFNFAEIRKVYDPIFAEWEQNQEVQKLWGFSPPLRRSTN